MVINGQSLGLGGYLDIGIIDTMKDLFVNFIGAVVFSVTGFFYARSKGAKRTPAQSFVPSKKTAEQDYLQQALEEADQKDADAPTPDGPRRRRTGGCLSAPHRQKTTGFGRWFFAAAAGICRPLLFDVTGSVVQLLLCLDNCAGGGVDLIAVLRPAHMELHLIQGPAVIPVQLHLDAGASLSLTPAWVKAADFAAASPMWGPELPDAGTLWLSRSLFSTAPV